MEAALKTFFSSPRFAVAGASSDPSKFGYKVFAWYLAHNLPATPINPSSSSITVRSQSYTTVASPSALQSPSEYSLSVITPPKVTKKLLQEAREAGIKAVWLQPGTFDDEIIQYVRKEWPDAHLAGFNDPPGTEAHDGWCVLVEGEKGMRIANRSEGGRL